MIVGCRVIGDQVFACFQRVVFDLQLHIFLVNLLLGRVVNLACAGAPVLVIYILAQEWKRILSWHLIHLTSNWWRPSICYRICFSRLLLFLISIQVPQHYFGRCRSCIDQCDGLFSIWVRLRCSCHGNHRRSLAELGSWGSLIHHNFWRNVCESFVIFFDISVVG